MEDRIFPHENTATLNDKLFIVCDGVGGRSKGEEASRIVCESISDYVLSGLHKKSALEIIKCAIDYSLTCMQDYATAHSEARQMSTTLALTYLQKKQIIVAWCGDSRVYHIRNGKILWKSQDHSLVQQLIDLGELSLEDSKNYPHKNIITRSLNPQRENSIADIHLISDYKSGDYLFLCTDGVLETIGDEILCTLLSSKVENPDKKEVLLSYAQDRTKDNYSMYLLQLSKSSANHSITILSLAALIIPIIVWFLIRML